MKKILISVCLSIYPNIEYTKNCLDTLSNQNFNEIEIICVTSKSYHFINNFLEHYPNPDIKIVYLENNINILDEINGEYLFLLDSTNWISHINIKNIYSEMKKDDVDIYLSNYNSITNKFLNHYANICNEPQEYKEEFFKIPTYINNFYKTEFIKKNFKQLPADFSTFDELFFYFKTMFSTNKILLNERQFIKHKRVQDNYFKELILSNFDLTMKLHLTENKKINFKNLFNNFKNILTFFENQGLYDDYKYEILNYIFRLLFNIYHYLNELESSDYYLCLKLFVENLDKFRKTELITNLKSKYLSFYTNLINTNTPLEFKLMNINNKLIIENDKLKFEKIEKREYAEKFFRGCITIQKTTNKNNNNLMVLNKSTEDLILFPSWLNNDLESGLYVESAEGSLDLKIKCIGDGDLTIKFKGVYFTGQNNKKIPIYLDLTKLFIDDKPIINENTLVYHDKQFSYQQKVKHNQELDIHFEWMPLNQNTQFNQLIFSKPLNTIRFDVKNFGDKENTLEILDVTDKETLIQYPDWFNDNNGGGVVFESSKNNIDYRIKCKKNGKLKLRVTGVDFKDQNNQKVPIIINLKKLQINKKTIINNDTIIFHDQPYDYYCNVTNNEELEIHAEWEQLNNKKQITYKNNIESPIKNTANTIQFEVKNFGDKDNNIKIIDITDQETKIEYPPHFKDENGIGATFKSSKNNIDYRIKCIKEGLFKLRLTGVEFKDHNDQKIPIIINLKKLQINNKTIINQDVLISINQPYDYYCNVTNNEELEIHAEWEQLNNKKQITYKNN